MLASAGTFAVGGEIEGVGIPAGTTVTAVGPGTTLTLSAPATLSGAALALHYNDAKLAFVGAISANGASAFFAASGMLANGGTPGATNVYSYHTNAASTSFIAAVGAEDYYNNARCPNGDGAFRDVGACALVNWYTTPDGQYLLFPTEGPLDGYNTTGVECATSLIPGTEATTKSCTELYRYSVRAAETGGQPVVCVSCGPGDVDAAGMAEFDRSQRFATAAAPVRAMSDNGEYVFFDSPARLVPQAESHTLHVYEWREGHGIALISSPNDPEPSYFLGYSPYQYTPKGSTTPVKVEGGNVFFGTHAKLVPQDTNTVGNVFDARICEPESPCIQPPPGETTQCEGSTCQHPPIAPADPTPTLLPPVALPGEPPPPPPKKETAAQIKAKHLAVALRLCRKKTNRHKRKVCEAQAKKKYGPAKKASRAKRASTNRRSGR